ncbi:MAG: HNH endonuclease [Actinomycetota bacterium]|nr:HNH endonuclease [Actinomycetota bacterium]
MIDLDDLEARRPGRAVDGPLLDGPSLQALLCDGAVHRMVTAGRSAVLDYGTTTHTIPAPLWNALVVRDEHCRFPGCDRPASWCEGHHVVPVVQNGPTCLANLVLACSRHHHRLHQPGWHAKLKPDATLEVTDPQGRQRTTASPRAGPCRGNARAGPASA